jgi:DNA-binding IclR family transcriptional regulator
MISKLVIRKSPFILPIHDFVSHGIQSFSLNFGKIIGGVAKGAGKVLGSILKREETEELLAREVAFESLDAREPEP